MASQVSMLHSSEILKIFQSMDQIELIWIQWLYWGCLNRFDPSQSKSMPSAGFEGLWLLQHLRFLLTNLPSNCRKPRRQAKNHRTKHRLQAIPPRHSGAGRVAAWCSCWEDDFLPQFCAHATRHDRFRSCYSTQDSNNTPIPEAVLWPSRYRMTTSMSSQRECYLYIVMVHGDIVYPIHFTNTYPPFCHRLLQHIRFTKADRLRQFFGRFCSQFSIISVTRMR